MIMENIRWIIRFQNFKRAYLKLKEAMEFEKLNELERNGLIQRFEFTLEMSWKTLKDYLEYKSFSFKPSPKDTVRLAQQSGFIDYAQEFIDGFELRNELSHDYSGEKFEKSEMKLRNDIYPAIGKLYNFFLEEEQKTIEEQL